MSLKDELLKLCKEAELVHDLKLLLKNNDLHENYQSVINRSIKIHKRNIRKGINSLNNKIYEPD